MKIIVRIAVIYLALMIGAGYGVLVGKFRYPPYETLSTLAKDWQFIWSDLTGGSARITLSNDSGTIVTADNFRDFLRPDTDIAWRRDPGFAPDGIGGLLVQGTFEINGVLGHHALLLDMDGRLLHTWALDERAVVGEGVRDFTHTFPHGLEYFDDGSIVYAFDGGVSLTRKDYCGTTVWAIPGTYHHAVNRLNADQVMVPFTHQTDPDPDKEQVRIINVKDGSIAGSFTLGDVMRANPDIDPLGIRQMEAEGGAGWTPDPFHVNDADPLTAEMAPYYPQFAIGDTLVSVRSLNLVMVVDPDTARIKWFNQGNVRRQHDPDWDADGISVFDNNMHRGVSHIRLFDPVNSTATSLFDGARAGFYTWIQGKHQRLADGTILISSPQQGRAFAVDASGKVGLEMLALSESEFGRRYVISKAEFIPTAVIEKWSAQSCN